LLITYEGTSYEFDLDDLTLKQAIKIEQHMDGPLEAFEKGIATGNLAAYQALGWLILHGGDMSTVIADVDFKIAKLSKAFEAAAKAEAEAAKAQAEPDPTGSGHAAASNGRKSARVSSPSG
jgi:hypothetical protein